MSRASFNVERSLRLKPVDLTTLINPKNGELATDINDSNKLKKYSETTSSWVEIGTGTASATVSVPNQLLLQDFDSAVLADFTQTGLNLVTAPVLKGTKTAQLIHQAATSQSFKQIKAVDSFFTGKNLTFRFKIRSTATTGNVTVTITNETASTMITSNIITLGSTTVSATTTSASNSLTAISASDITKLVVGQSITGAGIPTGTTIIAVGSTTATISANATASATVTLKVSGSAANQNITFLMPAACNSFSYTVTALQETGLPETYVDDVQVITATSADANYNLDTIFQFTGAEQISTWSTGNNATILGGGTLAGSLVLNTTTPLHESASYQYTQAAGSLNDYFFSPVTAIVGSRFDGVQSYLSFPFTYNGNTGDIQVYVYCATTLTTLTNNADVVQGTNGANQVLIAGALIPQGCRSIRFGFQVKVLNSGKVFAFDDVQLSSSLDTIGNANLTDMSQARFEGSTTRGSTDTAIVRFNSQTVSMGDGFTVTNTAANGTVITANRAGTIFVNATIFNSASGSDIYLSKNQATLTSYIPAASEIISGNSISAVSSLYVVAGSTNVAQGDKIRLSAFANPTSNTANTMIITMISQSKAIVTQTQQISSDTIPFAFKSTAIVDADPIGTFNTYTFAATSNTATIATTAPTQSASSMNTNGFQVFARPISAAGTAASPARIDVKIGKGLKSTAIALYSALAKTLPAPYDYFIESTTRERGTFTTYNELTGILTIDGATNIQTTTTTKFADSYSNAASAYFVFNASTTPSITALPALQQRTATITDEKANGSAGGAIATGSQTRTLNTNNDPSGVVTSLVANQFVLQGGTYYIEGSAPGYNCGQHKARLQNITDGNTAVVGSSEYSTGAVVQSRSQFAAMLTITAAKTFELQQSAASAQAGNGLGVPTSNGNVEVYSIVKITKVR